ncbi:MAG: hypothetical protein ACTHU0_09605 [Kofleriaceae bacterium]
MAHLCWHLIGAVALSACSFSAGDLPGDGRPPRDADVDAYVPDAGMCQTTGKQCVGPVLRTCVETGMPPLEELCHWGCLTEGATTVPHCGRMVPSGGAVLPDHLFDPTNQLAPKTLTTIVAATIDTDTGAIVGLRGAGEGVNSGIDFVVRDNVAIFRFASLAVTGDLDVRGSRALALVSLGDLSINGRVDARGTCTGNTAGPGGLPGGAPAADAGMPGGGTGGTTDPGGSDNSGGGGGGRGKAGGTGGRPNNGLPQPLGGPPFGDPEIPSLVGGAGGGGGGGLGSVGGGGAGGMGGGGGGAVQLIAQGTLRLSGPTGVTGGINAGGCAGRSSSAGGGGGGAGGAVLLESKFIELTSAIVAVNGGAGGAGGNAAAQSQDGSWDTSRAQGGGNGGNGGAAGANQTGAVGSASQRNGGGGGGGVGRIQIHSWNDQGVTSSDSTTSPRLTDTNTTATHGAVVIE